jgi:hypothetical protein
MTDNTKTADDPEGDHDPKALDEAAKAMHATKPSEADSSGPDKDPEGGHDEQALEDAEDKMGVQR